MASSESTSNATSTVEDVVLTLLGRRHEPLSSKDQVRIAETIVAAIPLDNLDQERQFITEQLEDQDVFDTYASHREELRRTLTEGNMGVPELVRGESKVVRVGARRRQRAQVKLAFDDNSTLNLELDARGLEKLLLGIKEAQAEAERAILSLRDN